jgi:hypothetical protein
MCILSECVLSRDVPSICSLFDLLTKQCDAPDRNRVKVLWYDSAIAGVLTATSFMITARETSYCIYMSFETPSTFISGDIELLLSGRSL